MEQRDIERAVISFIDSPDKLAILRSQRVMKESFVIYPQVYTFIEQYAREYIEEGVPSKELLQSKFSLVLPAQQDSAFFIKELKKRELGRQAHTVLEQGIELLVGNDDPEQAVTHLIRELSKLGRGSKVTRSLTDGKALERLDRYLQRKDAVDQGMTIGLQTGLFFFDEDSIGLAPGNLVGIIGNTSVGKSWLLEYISLAAYIKNEARVLFISPEMTIDEIEVRWDTLAARFHGVEFSNLGLARGRGIDVDAYKAFLEKVQTRKDWITCEANEQGGAFTLAAIEDLASQTNPDVVAIDGLPLLGTEKGYKGAAQWERLADIVSGLKNLAKTRNYVIIITNQATRDAEGRDDPRLKDSGYSYAFVQACDQVVMISVAKDENRVEREDLKLVRLMKRRVGKKTSRPIEIRWDVDRGIIG